MQLTATPINGVERFFDQPKLHREAESLGATKALKNALNASTEAMHAAFIDKADIRTLIYGRAWVIDQLLRFAWKQFDWPEEGQLSLIAVGGYGRGELHPHSDVDILLLMDGLDPADFEASISGFLTLLWDVNLDIGSSVRTLEECYNEARGDITIATNLVESRTLVGDKSLRERMYEQVTSEDAWSDAEFFKAKLKEQTDRHSRTNNTEYNLEPNIKNSPGGLRDLQTIGWVAKRHFGATYIKDLVEHGFLTDTELEQLSRGEMYLWRARYALHMKTNRREDRLLFDHQRTLAGFFGYEDNDSALAVEQFMSQYYRVAKRMSAFNDMLLQYFDEAILRADVEQEVRQINSRFVVRDDYLAAAYPTVFEHNPFALMELHVIMAQHPEIKGVRASTIRLIRTHRHLIDDDFRKDIRNTSLFMELLRSPERVSTELKRMNRYGILGRYLPEFGNIVGQMQHDLFHIYTVDAHTLKVIQMMRQFRHREYRDVFPIAHRVVNNIPKIELLYVAGLYHDIAKGRGGDHSELGAVDVMDFCQRHHLSKWDAELVAWLVKSHLFMSMTAQRKDLSDPEVINSFARRMGDVTHLDYLYVLTVADINATNNELWNSWRASLLRQLYTETRRALRRGLENPIDREERIEQAQYEALAALERQHVDTTRAKALWARLGEDYFLREDGKAIARHTQAIIEHNNKPLPLIMLSQNTFRANEGATEIFIHTEDSPNLFAATVAALDQLNLSVQDARIIVTDNGYTLNTYTVLTEDNQPLSENPDYLQSIYDYLFEQLDDPDDYPEIIQRRVPRQLKLFPMKTSATLSSDSGVNQTVLEVFTADRPGLLSRIGNIFSQFGIVVHKAKIANVAERVEDFFYITDADNQALTDPDYCNRLTDAICKELDEHMH